MAPNALEVVAVSKSFGSREVLRDLTFAIPAGSLFGMLGPNGAGKTTLFSILAGFLRADAGEVLLEGKSGAAGEQKGVLSLLPQDAEFQANIPIADQLVLFARLGGLTDSEARSEAQRVLERVGLTDYIQRTAKSLSHGMMKRLGIAQALIGQPRVILLDEPTAGLDPANAKSIRELIVSLQRHSTVVISSHDLREVQSLCTRVAILHRGRLVLEGAIANLLSQGESYEVEFHRPLLASEIESLRAALPRTQVDWSGMRVTLKWEGRAGPTEEWLAEWLQSAMAMRLWPIRITPTASLESKFLELTREK